MDAVLRPGRNSWNQLALATLIRRGTTDAAMKFPEEIKSETETDGSSSNSRGLHPLMPPIQRIPCDLLHEIVLHCLPIHPTIQSASPIISQLSLVSSAWRAVVLSSPRLWSRLFMTVQVDTDLGRCARDVAQWFERAQSVPISFFLNFDFEAKDKDVTRITTFLADLSSVMSKVQHFGLHARFTTELLSSLANLEWKMPQLENLDFFSHPEVNAVLFSAPLFHSAPNLVRVALRNPITIAPDILHILPWSQLTDVNMVYCIPVCRWIEVMTICPNMRVCEVTLGLGHDELSSSSLDTIGVHHHLRCLYLDIMEGCPPFLKLLSLYDFPSLQALHIVYQSEPRLDFPRPQGISALANLREFSFTAMGMKISREHFTYLAEVMREMVNLEDLDLQHPTQDFFPLYAALSFRRPEEAILPRLSALSLWVSSVPEQDEVLQLLEMVSSRCKEDTIPAGYEALKNFIVEVEEIENLHERIKKVFQFEPWVGELPPQLRFQIEVSPSHLYDQPEGWTFPISDY